MNNVSPARPGPASRHRIYIAAAAIAFAAGVFFRFWDLGGAPLAVDEYFFGSSILNIVARSLPEFSCGGFYTRGLLVQYLSVPVLSLGASLEYAVRFWPAISSLLGIIAVWRIGRRAGGIKVAAVAVILTSLSLWEIEFGRFGRMYAPFQAVFLWYVYFQIVHLMDGSNRARWSYIALSAVSIFVYAGASFLLVFNFLALVWSGKRWTPAHLVVSTILLVFGVGFFSTDFRQVDVPPEVTAPVTAPAAASSPADTASGISLPVHLPAPPEMALPVLVLGVALLAFVLFRFRSRIRLVHPSIVYWTLTVLCLCFGLFGLALALVWAGLLFRLPSPVSQGDDRRPGWFAGLAALVVVWLAVLFVLYGLGGAGAATALKNTLFYAVSYPDVYRFVLRPWFGTIPVTTTILLLMAASQLWVLLIRERHLESAEFAVQRYVAAALILLVTLSAFFYQPYTITRYTYFLYPLVLVFAAAAIVYWSAFFFQRPAMRAVATLAPIVLLFAVAEDFRPGHLLRINEPEYRFRTVYNDRLAAHYYTRWDYRSAADFVNDRLRPGDSTIVFDQPLPYYLNRTSGIFIREGTENHSLVYACGGKRDLWSNAPLLDTELEVRQLIRQTGGNVWLIVHTDAFRSRDPLEASLAKQYGPDREFVTLDAHLAVYRIPPPPSDQKPHSQKQGQAEPRDQ